MLVLFDGYCGLCNVSVDLLIKADSNRVFKYAPLQGKKAASLPITIPEQGKEGSIVLWDGKDSFEKSQAVFIILKKLPFPWKLFLIFSIFPISFSNWVYDLIAQSRYRVFGKKETCRIPSLKEKDLFFD